MDLPMRPRKPQAGREIRVSFGPACTLASGRRSWCRDSGESGLLRRRYRHARDRHLTVVCAICQPRRSLCFISMSVR